ncbi:MAG: hypothetical protein CM1200mP27_11500 [Chloroflexota bacterium]|nr:MAG: hypothetical protein CM1200mP27_11500 [Chloroflexota bacterium]
MPGLRELMDQLKNRGRQQLQQHNMDSVVDDLKERLEDIIQTEQEGIKRRLNEAKDQVDAKTVKTKTSSRAYLTYLRDAQKTTRKSWIIFLKGLSGQIQELLEYDFMDQEAQKKFQELLDSLKSQMAQNMGQQMMDQLKGCRGRHGCDPGNDGTD